MSEFAASPSSQLAVQTRESLPFRGQPLVSILIPLYNHERYIAACLDSVLADGYPELEIVILDDGSRDGSLRLAGEWESLHSPLLSGRVTIASRENRGLAKTLNELIAMARGEFIALLASDDLLLPGSIQARLDYLQAHAEKMAVFGDSVVIDKDGEQLHESALDNMSGRRINRGQGVSIRNLLADDEMLSYELIFNWSVPGPGFLARSELYPLVGGYDESLKVEDWDFYLRLTARGLLGYLDRPVAAYRVHGLNSGSSTSSGLIHFKDLMRTAAKHWPDFSGVKRYHLLALVLHYKAVTDKIEGHKSKSNFFHRIYKMLRWGTTKIYSYKLRSFSSIN